MYLSRKQKRSNPYGLDRNIVVNIASEDVPVGVTVNNQDKTITLDDGTAFNYETLEKISE